MWYLCRNHVTSIVEGKDNDNLCLCIQIGRFHYFCSVFYHKHSIKEKWYSFSPCIWSWKELQSYKPVMPIRVLVSHPSPNPKRTQIGTRARKVKRTRIGTRARNWNEIELELEHHSLTIMNRNSNISPKRRQIRSWAWKWNELQLGLEHESNLNRNSSINPNATKIWENWLKWQ